MASQDGQSVNVEITCITALPSCLHCIHITTSELPSLLDLVPSPSIGRLSPLPSPSSPLYPPVVVIKLGGVEALARSDPGYSRYVVPPLVYAALAGVGWDHSVLGAALRVAAFHFHSGGISVPPPLPGARWSAATSRSQVSHLFWISTAGVCAQRGRVLPLP